MVIVGITGAASTLGRTVIPLLMEDPRVEKLVAVDLQDCPFPTPSNKLKWTRADVRDRQRMFEILEGIDVVIHLAFVVLRNATLTNADIHQINVGGSRNVFEGAIAGSCRKIVHISSVAAYGIRPENDHVLSETAPLRGLWNSNTYYPYTKARVELILKTLEQRYPSVIITKIRPHIITGPHFIEQTSNLDAIVSQLSKPGKFYWLIKPKNWPHLLFQLTHERDLSNFIQFTVHQDLPGAYNLAADPVDLRTFVEKQGKKVMWFPWLPFKITLTAAGLVVNKIKILMDWIIGLRYPIVVTSEKSQNAYKMLFPSTEACLKEAIQAYKKKPKSPTSK